MISRILPVEEWFRLEKIGLPQLGPTMRPEDVQVVVCEDKGNIVAVQTVARVTHFEGLWIDPAYRGSPTLANVLWRASITAARKWANWVWGASDTDHMTDIIKRVGGIQLPIQSFMIHLGGD